MKKRYIIRKYVMADNLIAAIKLDKDIKAEEAWVDPDWLKLQDDFKNKIGFK